MTVAEVVDIKYPQQFGYDYAIVRPRFRVQKKRSLFSFSFFVLFTVVRRFGGDSADLSSRAVLLCNISTLPDVSIKTSFS